MKLDFLSGIPLESVNMNASGEESTELALWLFSAATTPSVRGSMRRDLGVFVSERTSLPLSSIRFSERAGK